ncbi:MAG: GIY-YIG nuclease family protein [Oscillospiraceae bacterium]|nr:GIY-YIG nuclease family protein [Oscillospiraceae bacterium]
MNSRKKELREEYKNRRVTGCVYIVRNLRNGRFYLNYSDVCAAAKNSWDLSARFGDPFKPAMREDWREHGPDAFSFEILEELVKNEDRTDREFTEDLQILTELWLEKLGSTGKRY